MGNVIKALSNGFADISSGCGVKGSLMCFGSLEGSFAFTFCFALVTRH